MSSITKFEYPSVGTPCDQITSVISIYKTWYYHWFSTL